MDKETWIREAAEAMAARPELLTFAEALRDAWPLPKDKLGEICDILHVDAVNRRAMVG